MAPKRAAALTPKDDAAPVFTTGGEAPVGFPEPERDLVAERVPVEMVLLAPWLGTMEAEAEAAEVMTVLTVDEASVEAAVEAAAEDEALVE